MEIIKFQKSYDMSYGGEPIGHGIKAISQTWTDQCLVVLLICSREEKSHRMEVRGNSAQQRLKGAGERRQKLRVGLSSESMLLR